jgi:hypothetical protein
MRVFVVSIELRHATAAVSIEAGGTPAIYKIRTALLSEQSHAVGVSCDTMPEEAAQALA